jgi:hypothetical protein
MQSPTVEIRPLSAWAANGPEHRSRQNRLARHRIVDHDEAGLLD